MAPTGRKQKAAATKASPAKQQKQQQGSRGAKKSSLKTNNNKSPAKNNQKDSPADDDSSTSSSSSSSSSGPVSAADRKKKTVLMSNVIGGFCDVCWGKDGFQNMKLLKCRKCHVNFHDSCYGIQQPVDNNTDKDNKSKKKKKSAAAAAAAAATTNPICWACKAVGTTVHVRNRDPSTKQRIAVTQTERPTECCLCGTDNGNEFLHAMHPVYDTYGPTGRQIYLPPNPRTKKPARVAWAHTLCCLVISSHTQTAGCVYGCSNDGSFDGIDDDDTHQDDDDVTVNSQLELKSNEGSIHHFVFVMKIKRNEPDNIWTKSIKAQKKLKCIYCGKNDTGPNNYRLSIQCSANDDNEYDEFQGTHRNLGNEPCYCAQHVGCAVWRKEEGTNTWPRHRRVYFFPGEYKDDGDFCNPVSNLFCDAHARDLETAGCGGAAKLRYPGRLKKNQPHLAVVQPPPPQPTKDNVYVLLDDTPPSSPAPPPPPPPPSSVKKPASSKKKDDKKATAADTKKKKKRKDPPPTEASTTTTTTEPAKKKAKTKERAGDKKKASASTAEVAAAPAADVASKKTKKAATSAEKATAKKAASSAVTAKKSKSTTTSSNQAPTTTVAPSTTANEAPSQAFQPPSAVAAVVHKTPLVDTNKATSNKTRKKSAISTAKATSAVKKVADRKPPAVRWPPPADHVATGKSVAPGTAAPSSPSSHPRPFAAAPSALTRTSSTASAAGASATRISISSPASPLQNRTPEARLTSPVSSPRATMSPRAQQLSSPRQTYSPRNLPTSPSPSSPDNHPYHGDSSPSATSPASPRRRRSSLDVPGSSPQSPSATAMSNPEDSAAESVAAQEPDFPYAPLLAPATSSTLKRTRTSKISESKLQKYDDTQLERKYLEVIADLREARQRQLLQQEEPTNDPAAAYDLAAFLEHTRPIVKEELNISHAVFSSLWDKVTQALAKDVITAENESARRQQTPSPSPESDPAQTAETIEQPPALPEQQKEQQQEQPPVRPPEEEEFDEWRSLVVGKYYNVEGLDMLQWDTIEKLPV